MVRRGRCGTAAQHRPPGPGEHYAATARSGHGRRARGLTERYRGGQLAAPAAGALLFPLDEVILLSGTTVSLAEGTLRALAVAVAVAASLVGLAALGLFVSTLANSGIAAMATTVGLLITVQILGSIPQLDVIHPYLFPHHRMSFADLLRDPVHWDDLLDNLRLQGLYAAVFGSAA